MTVYELIIKAQEDDLSAVEELYVRYSSCINRWSYKIYYIEAKTDITIKFLELINKIRVDRLEKTDEYLDKYIYKSIGNIAKNLIRSNNNKLQPIPYDFIENISDINNKYEIESDIFFMSYLDGLSDKQKKVIIDKFLYTYSDIELSKKYGISRQAVNKLKRNAINIIKKKN